MSFEFMQADLATPEGRDAYIEVYDATVSIKENTDSLTGFDDANIYAKWAADNPVESADFLQTLAGHQSPHIRSLAGHIALDWIPTNPDLATAVMEGCLADSDPTVVSSVNGLVHDMLIDNVFDDDRQSLGIMRLSRLIKAAGKTALVQSAPETK